MKGLVEFSIPVRGLGNGIHPFHFQIGKDFFSNFEESPIQDGDIEIDLNFDKRTDMYVLQFNFEGTVKTECDRCLVDIDLPISGDQQFLVKFSLEEEQEEAEVVYVSPEIQVFNVGRYIYEFIILAVPMIKVYDCENEENPACDEEMLAYLDGVKEQEQEETKETSQDNPIWDELKKLKKDN